MQKIVRYCQFKLFADTNFFKSTNIDCQEHQQTKQFEAILRATIVIIVFGADIGLLIFLFKRK